MEVPSGAPENKAHGYKGVPLCMQDHDAACFDYIVIFFVHVAQWCLNKSTGSLTRNMYGVAQESNARGCQSSSPKSIDYTQA